MANTAEAPLDVAGSASEEVPQRQRQQRGRNGVERGTVDPQRHPAEQPALQHRSEGDKRYHRGQADQHQVQQPQVPMRQHPVYDDFGEHGQAQFQNADDQRQQDRPGQDRSVGAEERPQPAQPRGVLGYLGERRRWEKNRGVAGPALEDLVVGQSAESDGRVGQANGAVVDGKGDHPMVAFPVEQRRHGEGDQVALGDLQRSSGQAQLGGSSGDAPQTGSVDAGPDRVTDSGQVDLAAEMAAHHGHARGTTVRLVYLPHQRKMADPSESSWPSCRRCRVR